MSRTKRRSVAAVAGPLLVGALVLGACGSDEAGGSTVSTVDLSGASTNFVVRPPATTEVEAQAAEISTGSQEYTVQAGDYPLKIANDFGITVDDLVAFNEWGSANEFPFPGTVIRIPPGATTGGAANDDAADDGAGDDGAAGDEASGDESAADETAGTIETIPDAGDNCGEGSYTIQDGDFPIGVADQFDVTIDALNAANAGTDGYSAFFPGLEIVIPAKADC